MKFKRGHLAATLAAGALAVILSPAPAQAFPVPEPGPGGGGLLNVYNYYDSAGNHVGQKWNGCGAPAGGWGIVTSNATYNTAPCS